MKAQGNGHDAFSIVELAARVDWNRAYTNWADLKTCIVLSVRAGSPHYKIASVTGRQSVNCRPNINSRQSVKGMTS